MKSRKKRARGLTNGQRDTLPAAVRAAAATVTTDTGTLSVFETENGKST